MNRIFALGFAALVGVSGSSALAATGPTVAVYDNFGPGSAHKVNSGRTVLGPSYPTQQELAVRFVPSVSGDLSEVDVAGAFVAGSNYVILNIASDSGGVPGSTLTPLADIHFLGSGGDPSGSYQAGVVSGSLPITAGTAYWIVATAGASNTDTVWDGTTNTLPGDVYLYNIKDGTGWHNDPSGVTASLRVLAVTVPEPSAALASLWAGSLLLLRRRRR
jgi:hypothetical protein